MRENNHARASPPKTITRATRTQTQVTSSIHAHIAFSNLGHAPLPHYEGRRRIIPSRAFSGQGRRSVKCTSHIFPLHTRERNSPLGACTDGLLCQIYAGLAHHPGSRNAARRFSPPLATVNRCMTHSYSPPRALAIWTPPNTIKLYKQSSHPLL